MHFSLKILLSNLAILLCVWLGRRHPSLGGLIATMPLTSLIVLIWLYFDNPRERGALTTYVGGVFFGVIPTLFFFGAVWIGLRKGFPLALSLTTGFVVWIVTAIFHQLLLK